jgi:hypothetical protein
LPRFCIRSVLLSFYYPARMPLCPTNGGLSVRFVTLDQNFFGNVNTYVVISTARCRDLARSSKALPLFQRYRKLMALTRSSCTINPTHGIGRRRTPYIAHVAVGSKASL